MIATTDHLQAGDVVVLPKSIPAHIRTVREVRPSGYLNMHNEVILAVMYEPLNVLPAGCLTVSDGNSGLAGCLWQTTTWHTLDEFLTDTKET